VVARQLRLLPLLILPYARQTARRKRNTGGARREKSLLTKDKRADTLMGT